MDFNLSLKPCDRRAFLDLSKPFSFYICSIIESDKVSEVCFALNFYMRMKRTYLSIALATALFGLVACNSKDATTEENTNEMPVGVEENTELITEEKDLNMKFELVKLPYANNALEPVISEKTIDLHHGKHLQTYVNNLNKLIEGTEFADMELIDIVKKSEGGIFNNAGQTLNHNLYFLQFTPNNGGEPTGDLKAAIEKKWGSVADFKKQFEADATALFGAGWAWLATDKEGNLSIQKYSNAGNPVVDDLTPLMGADVWEHAYYVDYENRRADHLAKMWDIIDWNVIGKRYTDR